MAKPSVSMPDPMLDNVDNRLRGHTDRSKWIQAAIRMRLTIEQKAEASAEELPEGWWDEGLDRYLEWRRAHPERAAERDSENADERERAEARAN